MAATNHFRNDDLYQSMEETPVRFVTHWRAPFTGGGTGILPRGTIVRLIVVPEVKNPSAYYARPLDPKPVEELLVPLKDRTNPKYDGFSLVLSVEDLSTRFSYLNATSARTI